MTIVTRFPPSPTGRMHIGTARTALYNWLFARRHGGKMLFRIEDTDRERYAPEYVDAIVNGLKWLELDWDGEIVSQFEQRNRHAEVAAQLLASGNAYYCYATPEELEAMRVKAREEGRSGFYDRRWRDRTPADAPPGLKPAIRIKAPLEGSSTVNDRVQGAVTVDNRNLDDFIILRSDGTPTYMLSVVVDDHDMGVTHVIRGDDHLNNTFRQNVIYEAMGWALPEYAHLPLILGPDGAKMSKRHGATSVEEYRDMGYLPEAMRNYLLRLGWSHGDDELITTQQALEWFDLEHIGQSAARFDFTKLESVNAHYMVLSDDARLLELAEPLFLSRLGLTLDETSRKWLLAGMNDLKKRAKTLLNLVDEAAFYVRKRPLAYDEKAKAVLGAGADQVLEHIKAGLSGLNDFRDEKIEQVCRDVAAQSYENKLGKVAMPFRAALTGATASPPVFKAAEIMGPAETNARLDDAIAHARSGGK